MPQSRKHNIRRGHPGYDDREPLLGFMNGRIAQGMNVTEAAAGGLRICHFVRGSDGVWVLSVERELPPPTLERRFRTMMAAENVGFEEMVAEYGIRLATSPAIIGSMLPAFFMSDGPRKRGRSKKKSRRVI